MFFTFILMSIISSYHLNHTYLHYVNNLVIYYHFPFELTFINLIIFFSEIS